MVDILLVAFIIFMAVGSGIIFGLYKIVSLILRKMSFNNWGIKVWRIIIAIVSLLFGVICLRIGIWNYKNPAISDPDYNRAIYSVIIYNSTDIEIDGLEVCAGDNRILAQTVDDIQPKEYRKINIPTHDSDFFRSIDPPYNVYVRVAEDINIEMCVGYFGMSTGGVEAVSVMLDDENNILLEKMDHSSNSYIKIYRMNRKDQDLLSWYD